MDRRDGLNTPSPLRNSKAANRPFRSPLHTVLNPCNKVDLNEKRVKVSNVGSSCSWTPEKRISRQPRLLGKKICLENEHASSECSKERSITEDDLKQIKDRICAKKQQLESVKRQLLYNKKHEAHDLNDVTERWLRGCQEALIQFQKDISCHSGTAVSMSKLLEQLGIPPELVQYSVEDCDFMV
ncbi:uncharacterized protein LOC124406391 [Diprion similis]|uniref:uncharacterized protein LOC124406391 n=1 Tax=Diprion similis TaxID=362088 RepID=UPI001EF784DA|nr:uncharacterized protein LOC124406391 [Diprion similis]XP_046737749.1 uncharacterized protein LOC124406391 [Diprion similis]XP_046737750.1 uncharacterized protein LOC124406391 [Diprion similis]XP_046737751.1 uncharacterized protein LOC124406391 [Diprion similis]